MKRFTLYTEEALIPQAKLARELVSLLEDEPFRVVSQLDLASEHLSFQDVVTCLEQHYGPQTNALQRQHQLLNRKQGSDESLTKFAGELRMLADKAYPEWTVKQRWELAKDQFIRGVMSSSIQLDLMKTQPENLEKALASAHKQESVEEAQKSYISRDDTHQTWLL